MSHQPEVIVRGAGSRDRRARRPGQGRDDDPAAPAACPGQPQSRARVPAGQAAPARVAVAGAHGGAGASTLAALLAPAWDLGTVRPRPLVRPLPPVPLVLAARCTAGSAARAVAAVRELAGQGTPVAVLAVTSDGLPEPAEAAYRFRVLEGRVGGLVRVPFIPALRVCCDPRQARLPRSALRALDEIRSLAAGPGGPGH
jgi:hypothetical protein